MTNNPQSPFQSSLRKLFILLLGAAQFGIERTAWAVNPDYAIASPMAFNRQMAVGERGYLQVEISNLCDRLGETGFYQPVYDLLLLKSPELSPAGVFNNPNSVIMDFGNNVKMPYAPRSTESGDVRYRIPPVPPGNYFLVAGLSTYPYGFEKSPEPEFHDADPANNFRSVSVYIGLPDLVFTNAVVSPPHSEMGDRSVTISIENIGTGDARAGIVHKQIVLSTTTNVVGGSVLDNPNRITSGMIPDILATVSSEGLQFRDSPRDTQLGSIEMTAGSRITETVEITRDMFQRESKTVYLICRLSAVQDIRYPPFPDAPEILRRFADGPLVEANTDNNVLIIPIHLAKPRITLSPVSQSKRPGSTVVFRAEATDFNSLQWLFNGNPIPGETNATLTLANLQPGAAGTYAVSAINELGSVTSDPAVLTIQLPPTVTQSPISQIVGPGSEVTLTVAASSSTPFSYQWRRNGRDIPGATDASYVFSATEGGQFTVVVSNAAGSAESAPATVSLFSVETFPGTVLTGPTGGTYRIEFRNALDPATAWQPAATLTLTNSPAVWIDQTLPPRAHRFYRAVFIP